MGATDVEIPAGITGSKARRKMDIDGKNIFIKLSCIFEINEV